MNFPPKPVSGAWLVEQDRKPSKKGFFARSFHESSGHGIDSSISPRQGLQYQRKGKAVESPHPSDPSIGPFRVWPLIKSEKTDTSSSQGEGCGGSSKGGEIRTHGLLRAVVHEMKREVSRALTDPLPNALGEACCITVDPLRIRRYGLTPVARAKAGGTWWRWRTIYLKSRTRFVLPGQWDLGCELFCETDRYQFIAELRRYDFDYTRCSRFRILIDQVKRGEMVRYKSKGVLLQSEEDVHAYLQSHVKVCKSMIEHGYIPDRAKDHICVMVGREGELIKEVRGRHRLAIAQVFQVPSVLVLVRHVHPIWVQRQKAQMRGMPLDEILRCALKRLEIGEREPAA